MKKLTKLVLSLIIAISTFCIPIYAEDEAVTNEMEYILLEQRYEEFIDQLKIGVENEIGSSDFKILGYRKQNYLEEVPAYQTQEYIGETTQIRSVGYASINMHKVLHFQTVEQFIILIQQEVMSVYLFL